jgi:oligopeptide/dipeptide ABC transporter ATP-binding protein
MSAPALSVEHLTLAIGDAVAVDDISFSLGPGEVMAIVGESGCGKSITALAIMRLLPPAIRRTGGTIRCGDDDITSISERAMQAIRGRRMSMIFQEPQAALDPLATIGTQVAEALRQPLSRARSTVRKMLEDVGIADPERRIDQRPFEMSGGMCQRVMIASALISRPTILIADEPTTALDVTVQAQILDLLRKIAVERQTAVVLITHDMGVVADIADRVAVMYAGRLAEAAPAEAIFTAPRHPYTALLLAAIPRISDIPKSQLASIDGRVPAPAEYGLGCRFANRCPRADARCTVETPKLRPVGPTHLSACHYAEAMQ